MSIGVPAADLDGAYSGHNEFTDSIRRGRFKIVSRRWLADRSRDTIPQQMKITLDSNCLIALERDEQATLPLRSLVELHISGRLQLCISAISASERKRSGVDAWPPFQVFLDRLAEARLSSVGLLRPIGYWGIVYVDQCWSNIEQHHLDLEQEIHHVLFPKLEFSYEAYCTRIGIPHEPSVRDHRWLNAKCDVQALWCHIYSGNDVFVTSDKNFHKATKHMRLIELGAKEILTPEALLRQIPV